MVATADDDVYRPQRSGDTYMDAKRAEYRPFYRALWQKRTINLRSLLMVATPYDNLYLPPPRIDTICIDHREVVTHIWMSNVSSVLVLHMSMTHKTSPLLILPMSCIYVI